MGDNTNQISVATEHNTERKYIMKLNKLWDGLKRNDYGDLILKNRDAVEEEPDEIAMQFLSAKMALDSLVELFADDLNTAEILTEMKTRLEIIENRVAR